jgi:branched-chain amino acid transport system substrate-binding protein
VERSSDGILRLGVLVPLTDEQAPFGPPLVPVLEAVVRIINSFGGYEGKDIELVVRDEGSNLNEAQRSTNTLIVTDQVDAVVGPFSSLNAPGVIPSLISAGVGVCSPTASSQLLDAIDDDGLFIRTATLDSVILENMVELAVQSGSEQVALAYPDDPYGRALARVLRNELNLRQLNVVSTIPYAIGAGDYQETAAQMAAGSSSVKIIIGEPIDGPRFLNAVVNASGKSVIITNDGLVNAEVIFDPEISPNLRPRVFGFVTNGNAGGNELLNVLRVTDREFPKDITLLPEFAVNTVDCLILFWLAALTAESDIAQDFKSEILRVANEGSSCLWIADCKSSVDEGLNIDFQGINGLTLDESGNAVDRSTLVLEFDADGRAQIVQGLPNVTLTG